jgi:hypothetical protein
VIPCSQTIRLLSEFNKLMEKELEDQVSELYRRAKPGGNDHLFEARLFPENEECDVRVRPRAPLELVSLSSRQIKLLLGVVRLLVEDGLKTDECATPLGNNLELCTSSGTLADWFASFDKTFVIKSLLKILGGFSRMPDTKDLTEARQGKMSQWLGGSGSLNILTVSKSGSRARKCVKGSASRPRASGRDVDPLVLCVACTAPQMRGSHH